jgi:hypothetical protein
LHIEAHFDESGTDHSSYELTLAGYLFESDRMEEFCNAWKTELAIYNLPYFHMVDCAHRSPPFEKMQMGLMHLIKRYSINGIVCNIKNRKSNSGGAYFEAARRAVNSAVKWADQTSYSGRIEYFLEAGAFGTGLLDCYFSESAANPASLLYGRYAGHAFIPKEGNPGVQAADLLAWQYQNYTKKRSTNDIARLDLRALLRHPHYIEDDCGALPRESKIQSVSAASKNIEVVYYLPKCDEDKNGLTLAASKDFTNLYFLNGSNPRNVLACSNCLRALVGGVSIMEINSFIHGANDKLMIRCWCGTTCLIPKDMVPFAH